MKIGVDVDGVLTNLEDYQLKYGKKYFKDAVDIDENAYDICDIFHCSKEEREKFWTKYIWGYSLNEPVRAGMQELLQRLSDDGNRIFIITGRAHTTEENARGSLFRKMLIAWLDKNNIPYEKIYYCDESNSSDDKYDICKRLGIDVMIEDKTENIEKIQSISSVLCIANRHNQHVTENGRVKRIDKISRDTYDEIYRMGQHAPIDKMNSDYEKQFDFDKYRLNYGVIRSFGVPLFKTLLKPTILNKEYIPKNGPLLLCGNHLHVWDQFPVICATTRTTHWMSKKEYFDSKLGPFFKKTGAICVDRQGDAHKSTITALNYLDIDSAVGLFPEGTRNRLKQSHIDDLYEMGNKQLSKEEFSKMMISQNPLLSQTLKLQQMYLNANVSFYDFCDGLEHIDSFLKNILSSEEYMDTWLLPFKFGAVSMAQRTGATVVPFGVTGDYTIDNNNLIVNFGEGFKVRPDDSLEEMNTMLRGKILQLVKENKEKKM